MNYTSTVGVIGGGSVAVSFVYHLVEALVRAHHPSNDGLRVLVFEPRELVGRGSAYDVDLETNLLNVTVGAMSAVCDDKSHFKRWLNDRGIDTFAGRRIEESSFVSRPLFGRYLEWAYNDAVERARAIGVSIEHVRSAIMACRPISKAEFALTTANDHVHTVHDIVLTIGNLDSTAFPELRHLPDFFATPYVTSDLSRRIERDAPICVLGTSLSAVDAILALVSQGHNGCIHAVSRNGRLPSVRGIRNTPVSLRSEFTSRLLTHKKAGTTIQLDELFSILKVELLASCKGELQEDLFALAHEVPDALDFLDREIHNATSMPRQWQAFGNALNENIDVIWHLLSYKDRNRFNREFKAIWMSRRVTFPLENAQAMRELLRSGQLRVSGGFQSARHDPNRDLFAIDLRHRCGIVGDESVNKETFWVTHLVNATSFSSDAEHADMPVLRSLLDQGLVTVDSFGGLKVDFDSGYVVSLDGKRNERITALGSMVSGTYFWTNAMEINARLAMGQARRLAAALTQPRYHSKLGNVSPNAFERESTSKTLISLSKIT